MRTEGLCLATLRNYLKRQSVPSTPASGDFVEIERAGAFLGGEQRHSYRICLSGGVELEIPVGFSNREVVALLEAISTMGGR